MYNRRAEPMLVSLSDLYSVDEIFVSDSRPSSCPAYMSYWLLFLTTNLYFDFSLRRPFYSKQYFRNACCSSAQTDHKRICSIRLIQEELCNMSTQGDTSELYQWALM